MLIVAVMAPIMGAFGDFKGWRKKLFFAFMMLGVAACAFLAFLSLIHI